MGVSLRDSKNLLNEPHHAVHHTGVKQLFQTCTIHLLKTVLTETLRYEVLLRVLPVAFAVDDIRHVFQGVVLAQINRLQVVG